MIDWFVHILNGHSVWKQIDFPYPEPHRYLNRKLGNRLGAQGAAQGEDYKKDVFDCQVKEVEEMIED